MSDFTLYRIDKADVDCVIQDMSLTDEQKQRLYAAVERMDFSPIYEIIQYMAESIIEDENTPRPRELHTIPEIKEAVDAGEDVRAGNDNYRVIKDKLGQYLIHFTGSPPNWIGLHGREGTKYENELNMTPIYSKGMK